MWKPLYVSVCPVDDQVLDASELVYLQSLYGRPVTEAFRTEMHHISVYTASCCPVRQRYGISAEHAAILTKYKMAACYRGK